MIRITRLAEIGPHVRLSIEGQLTARTTDQIRQTCAELAAEGKSVVLEVSGVVFADRAGVDLLRALQSRGVSLAGCSGFLEESLRKPVARAGPRAGSEDDLVVRLRAGDEDAFETLVRTHGPRMLATARRFFTSDHDAYDAVQEAFVSAFRAIDTFAGGSTLATWLHRIVINAALMQLRSRRRRSEDPIEDLLPHFDEDGRWADRVGHSHPIAEAQLEREETRTMVRACIAELPEIYRTVLLLRDIEELEAAEVAAALKINLTTVKVRLHRARQALRTLITRRTASSERKITPAALSA